MSVVSVSIVLFPYSYIVSSVDLEFSAVSISSFAVFICVSSVAVFLANVISVTSINKQSTLLVCSNLLNNYILLHTIYNILRNSKNSY